MIQNQKDLNFVFGRNSIDPIAAKTPASSQIGQHRSAIISNEYELYLKVKELSDLSTQNKQSPSLFSIKLTSEGNI